MARSPRPWRPRAPWRRRVAAPSFASSSTPRPRRARLLTRARLGLPLLAVFAALIALGARGESGEAQALRLGVENSWIRVQNLGAEPASVAITFYDEDGDAVAEDACPEPGNCNALRPGFGWSFFQQGFEELEEGYQGSAYVAVDQPFVALLARDVFQGGRFRIGGDTLRHVPPTDQQYLPIVQNTSAYVSRITIENVSSAEDACVVIEYFSEGSSVPAAVDSGSGSGCPDGGQRLPPRGSWVRDETSLPVPSGFDGAAVVSTRRTSSGVAASQQQIVATVDTRERNGPGLATSRSLDADELSRVIALPLADRDASEGQSSWSTRFRIVSEQPAIPNDVTLLFEGTDRNGAEIEIEHTVTVRGALTCDQRRDGIAGCLPLNEGLPSTFFGTVRLQSVEPIAVVAQRISPDGALADYRGFTAEEAARQVVLPVLNKNYGPFGGNEGWNSWFRVLTFDGSTAHVRVIYYSSQFEDGLFMQPRTVERQRTFRQWEEPSLPDGWVGSAIVIADRPIVVVSNLESDVFNGDPVMLYNGLGFD